MCKYEEVIDLLKSNRPLTLCFRGKGIPEAVKPLGSGGFVFQPFFLIFHPPENWNSSC